MVSELCRPQDMANLAELKTVNFNPVTKVLHGTAQSSYCRSAHKRSARVAICHAAMPDLLMAWKSAMKLIGNEGDLRERKQMAKGMQTKPKSSQMAQKRQKSHS